MKCSFQILQWITCEVSWKMKYANFTEICKFFQNGGINFKRASKDMKLGIIKSKIGPWLSHVGSEDESANLIWKLACTDFQQCNFGSIGSNMSHLCDRRRKGIFSNFNFRHFWGIYDKILYQMIDEGSNFTRYFFFLAQNNISQLHNDMKSSGVSHSGVSSSRGVSHSGVSWSQFHPKMDFGNMLGTQIVSNIKLKFVINILQFLCELKLKAWNFLPQHSVL